MKGRRWVVTPNGLKIGRDKSCEIPIDELSSELFHCIVKLVNGRPAMQNLASSRGVDVNGTNVNEAELDPGDTISIGNERFVLMASDPGNAAALVRKVSIAAILLGLAVIGVHFFRQKFLRGRPRPKPPAADVAKDKPDAVTTNRVVRLVGEEIVTTNRVVRIVDNVVVTNYVIEVRRGDETKVVGTVEEEVVVPPPGPTEGLKFSEDGKTLVFVPKDLTSVTIPDGVTAIADRAFENHKALERVAIPPSVTKFGRDAFKGCDNLTGVFISDLAAWCRLSFEMDGKSWDNPLCYAHNLYLNGLLVRSIEIPKSVSSIGKYAFRGCTSLTRVMIPRNVTYIDAGAFADCGNLKEFAVAEDSNHYKSVDGLLLTKDGRTLVAVPGGLEAVKIPDGVVTIGDCAFLGCKKVSKVSIPDGVTSIGYKAFAKCSGLEIIEMPPSMMKFGPDAFGGCNKLAKVCITDLAAWCRVIYDWHVTLFRDGCGLYLNGNMVNDLVIPDGVESIVGDLFRGCASLTRVTIPKSLERCSGSAFANCPNLVEFRIENGNRHFKLENGMLLTKDGKKLVAAPGGIESAKIPDCVVEILGSAFKGCRRLSEVKIPNGVVRIGFNAFDSSGLKSVVVPDGVKTIGGWAFIGCPNLVDVTIAGSVENIGVCAFAVNRHLENVVIHDGVRNISGEAFSGARIKSIAIPGSVTNIAEKAFAGCRQLESVTVPEGLTNIHERAFAGCSKLLDANGKPRLTRVPGKAKRK